MREPGHRSFLANAWIDAPQSGRLRSAAMAIVNHVGLCVTDLERSRRFYEAVLGFTHQRDLHVPDAADVAAAAGARAGRADRRATSSATAFVLELLHFDREGNAPRRERSFTEPGLTHLSFSVDDIAGDLRSSSPSTAARSSPTPTSAAWPSWSATPTASSSSCCR